MAKGFKMDVVPAGADPTRYRPGIKKERARIEDARRAAWEALPEDEKQRRRDAWARELRENEQWRKDFDQFGPDKARELRQQREAKRREEAAAKDEEARLAVEGGAA